MSDILALLDDRERAILIWLGIGLVLALISKNVRGSAVSLITILLSRPVLVVLTAMVLYVSLIVFAGQQLSVWQFELLKDTVIWSFGPAFIMVLNHDDASRDPNHFKKTLLATLQVTLLVEFVINFYVLHILWELVLVPVAILLAALLAVAETKQEYAPARRLAQFLLGALGLALLGYAGVRLTSDLGSFATLDALKLFLLPVALTVVFIPFVYALAVYSGYQNIFLRLTIWVKDKELAGYLRRQILQTCLFRLARVNKFRNEYVNRLGTINSKPDAAHLMREFRGSA